MNDSRLLVVRVWRQLTAFRASVRRVEDEDTRLFDDATEVARYLEASAAPGTSPSGASAPAAPQEAAAAPDGRGETGRQE